MNRYFKCTILVLCSFLLLSLLSFKTQDTTLIANAKNIENENLAYDDSIDLPIIMYHSILNKNIGKYTVPPSLLESDLIYIKENGFNTVLIKDLLDYKEGKTLPDKPIMITFDDGSLTNYLYAFKLLKKYNMKAVISVVGSYVDSNYDKDGNLKDNQKSCLNYEHIREMSDSGLIEIQNHSYDMHRLGKRKGLSRKKGESLDQYKKVLSEDLMKNQKKLKEKASVDCTAVAFPFGAYSENTIEIVKELGFKAVFTCTEGINRLNRNSDLFMLKRFNRPFGASSKAFFNKIFKS